MKTYRFDIQLEDVTQVTDELADALFAAGCDDGTPASSEGSAWVHFDRAAGSPEDAVSSAAAQVRAAGLKPANVEFDVGYTS